MIKARAIALAQTAASRAADEVRGVIVCACALSLIVASLWQPF